MLKKPLGTYVFGFLSYCSILTAGIVFIIINRHIHVPYYGIVLSRSSLMSIYSAMTLFDFLLLIRLKPGKYNLKNIMIAVSIPVILYLALKLVEKAPLFMFLLMVIFSIFNTHKLITFAFDKCSGLWKCFRKLLMLNSFDENYDDYEYAESEYNDESVFCKHSKLGLAITVVIAVVGILAVGLK